MYTFESLTKSLTSEKCHDKDNIRNISRLEDKPRISLGHHKDIVRTTKRQKGQMKTNSGQTKDKPRTAKGLSKGRTDREYNFGHCTKGVFNMLNQEFHFLPVAAVYYLLI